MKKFFSLLFVASLLFSFVACTKDGDVIKQEIKATTSYQVQVEASIPGKEPDVRGASVTIGDYEEKSLYDAVLEFQKALPEWEIKTEGVGRDAVILSMVGVANGQHGADSKWVCKINENQLQASLYETKLQKGDVITFKYEIK